ncbi:MAG TPA: HtaA domain-containing protein [Solirubrobacterales bacterium]|nr:HtaA domain-containing protein [Solirubrobacterales bacterium]
MSSNVSRRSRLAAALGLAALVALSATVAPASAYKGQGEAVIVAAKHAKGRTLSGQGVKLLAGAGASAQDRKLSLPIAELNPFSQPSASHPSAQTGAALTFQRGKRSLALTEIRFNVAAGTLVGKLGASQIEVFRVVGAASNVNTANGTIALNEGQLRLTAAAADQLETGLGLKRALNHKGVGMLWLAAQASPTHGPAQKVTGGALDWGFLTSWREYIYRNLGPGSVGSITTEGGATTVGEPSKPGSYFSFPATGGSYQQGLFGATDKLSLNAGGSVKFAKPGHCIVEIRFSDIVATLGSASSIVADLDYDIDQFNGMGCNPVPPVSAPDTEIATLGSVNPSVSGSTITWAGLPATLTAAASAPFAPTYKAGHPLDPATISVQVEPIAVPAG